MLDWENRAPEVKYLLNPAFCGRLIYTVLKEYEKQKNAPMPFPLVYLILPLVLHKQTRDTISSSTRLLNWIQTHQNLLIGFASRVRGMIDITNETLDFLLGLGIVQISNSGSFVRTDVIDKLSENKFCNEEIKECINKSKHIAKWFAKAGSVTTIYVYFGVRP